MDRSASAPVNPRIPPLVYGHREKPNYRTSNPFSHHDNRNRIQDFGEYLGNGSATRTLGRRLQPTGQRLHRTEHTLFHHQDSSVSQQDCRSITATSYSSPRLIEPSIHRRFPRTYGSGTWHGSLTETTAWHNIPFRTPLHVLAVSQKPFDTHNNWKYSFHGDHSVYPPYKITKKVYT